MKRLLLTMALVASAMSPALAQAGKLSIANQTGGAIAHIYASPIDINRFGPDLLKGSSIQNGRSFAFADLPNGLYDMKVVDAKGAECLLKDVDYFQYSIWTITPNCGAFGGTGN